MTAVGLAMLPADTSRPVLDLGVGTLLREAAADGPDRAVLVSVAPGEAPRTWTYAEMLADATAAAGWLGRRFAPGEHVAVWAPNVPEWLVLQYGAALAGLVLVTANPALRDRELEHVLRQSRAAGVAYVGAFRGSDMASAIERVLPAVPSVREAFRLESWLDEIRGASTATDLPDVDPGSPTQIQFTSGTTGVPKAAVLRHRAMVTNAAYVRERSGSPEGAVWVSAMPLFHTAGCGLGGLGTLVQRGTLVLGQVFEPGLVLDAIEEHRAQHLMAVPAMLRALLAHPRATTADLSSLRVVASGGDAVPPELVDACERTFGAAFSTVYGQTELSPIVTQTSPDDAPDDQRTTAGRPLPNVDVAILDPSSGEVLPIGTTGEICARGYQAMTGYLDMPDETARTIDADGWVHTGDLGSLDARGYLRVTGRLKDLIIRGGENIYPREVERALLDHPAVSDVVVLGVPDQAWGERVVAVVAVAEDAARPSGAALQRFVRGRLAPHKAPKEWFVADAFPTNAMGKLQKFRLLADVQGGRLQRLDD